MANRSKDRDAKLEGLTIFTKENAWQPVTTG